ncbi:MAG: lysine biosynthesis protein LysX [Candidatus Methanomethylicota archaeon]|uniref:Lysine biosynthesis protein LysX n=1 Tax=Thermoproteota archaeon TaxID=2056631 RepID=A0A520KF59_9CREN|nr:MAG: lysine biosynthesis protein LysX [Candidatus Verstraetearchaeota archaeon]TDA40523.1 MAG: lysine biosynthesis protein LysX [Candidatus Verstraetearchaeota archaeon]
MPILSLLYDRIRTEEKLIINTAEKKGIELRPIDVKDLHLVITDPNKDKEIFGDIAIERCVSYFRGLHLTAILEGKGIRVINPYSIMSICGNKMLTSILLAKNGIPTPKTIIAFTKEEALKAIEEIGFPAVIKPVFGSWGRLIAQVKDKDIAQVILEHREEINNPLYQIYYIQEMIERPPRDIRCIVIDNEIIASIYRYSSPEDWRTNIARGGRAEVCNLTEDMKEIILKTSEIIGGGVLGIDAMESKNGIVIHEVNATVEFKGAMSATGIDIPGKIIEYALKLAKK